MRKVLSGPADCEAVTLVTVDSVKYLGITVDSELKFGKHIGNVVARAHARANLIHKCFLSRDAHTLMRAFIVCETTPSIGIWFLCLVPTFQE